MLDFNKETVIWPRLSAHDGALLASLTDDGVVCSLDADRAMANALRLSTPIAEILLRQFDLDADLMARHQAKILCAQLIDPYLRPPDPALVAKLGAEACLRDGFLPWQCVDDTTVILTPNPQNFTVRRHDLEQVFGTVQIGIVTEVNLITTIETLYAPTLTAQAETCVTARESCRDWDKTRVTYLAAICLLALIMGGIFAPNGLVIALMIWAVAIMAFTSALKISATIFSLRAQPAQPPPVPDADLPVITVLVPLYRETAIASHLLVRLAALRYPRALLDVCLVLEQDDATTRATLARTTLPGWMRAISVPPGQVKTKPRALNYAMRFARGSIIGVWDAEDAPAPDQLHVVARHFATAPPDVACLQGILDYYNTGSNWLTRCFTIEYAAWFRVVLPGLARMGLVVPLGGTTLFFRRDILQKLGGWDAHNVTEDADLGLRLARHGYRTMLIPTVTMEEANGRPWPWIKQRSRWLKGYAMTYSVHMRNPRSLLRDLGWWRFFGVQILFGGTLSLFVLMPLIWTLWLIPMGFGHPVQDWLPPPLFKILWIMFFIFEIITLTVNFAGLHKAKKLRIWGWILTMPFYFPLGAVAAYRGLTELVTRPFYWDKTAHGIVRPVRIIPPPRPQRHPVSAA